MFGASGAPSNGPAPRLTLARRWRLHAVRSTSATAQRATRRDGAVRGGPAGARRGRRAIDLPKRKAEDAVPAFLGIAPPGPGPSSAVTRTGAGSRASPRPKAPIAGSSCSPIRCIAPGSPIAPPRASPTGRRSLARPCCCPARPTRSPGSTCCGRRCRLAARRARHVPAPRAHAEAGPRRRPRPGGRVHPRAARPERVGAPEPTGRSRRGADSSGRP